MWVELRPNIAGPIFVLAALDVGNAVLLLSGLSFLGLGAKPPTAEWGSMVSEGVQNFNSWWIGLFPGLAILLLCWPSISSGTHCVTCSTPGRPG